jgi:Do/DeqQ family serine protease
VFALKDSAVFMKNVVPIIISSLLSACLAIFLYRFFEKPQEVIIREVNSSYINLAQPTTSASIYLSATPTSFTNTSETATPAVVNIRAQAQSKFDFWSNSNKGTSSGSGVIISEDGYIITNNHVIEDGASIQITLSDKREFEARKVGFDPSTDLALLKIEARDLPYLKFANSDSLRVGEWVLAVGNPFNLESTVTAGIVSAKGRDIKILEGNYRIESFIQTDAMVNPGNSGGALVNMAGDLVGINTAIMSRSGSFEGYSFAIPANLVRKIIEDLRIYGEVKRGILGVEIAEVDNRLAKKLGLKQVQGVYIKDVSKGGGAAQAGIMRGDVIVEINNTVIKTVPELQEYVARFRPGDSLEVGFIRGGKRKNTKVKLQKIKESTELASLSYTPNLMQEIGLEVRDLKKEEKKRLSINNGVKVISIYKNSPAESVNMEIGFIIEKVNEIPIANLEELLTAIELMENEIILEGYYENFSGKYLYRIPMFAGE